MCPRSTSDWRSTSAWPACPARVSWPRFVPSSPIASARCPSRPSSIGSGKATEPVAPPPNPNALDTPRPGDIRQRPVKDTDDEVSDRIIAVVNNDAITLNELVESILVYRAENRQASGGPTDEELRKESLARLIDSRLQLQEADREKITVDDAEFNDEFLDRIKRYNVKNEEEFERLVKAQGVTVESIKKRLRDSLRVNKLINRKVAMRISVTEDEISQYLEDNRAKLE